MAENKTLEHLPEVRGGGGCPLPGGTGGAGGGADLALQADSAGAVQGVCGQHRLFRI